MIELCKPNAAITSNIIISRRWDSLHGWLPISSYLTADSQYGWLLTLPLRQGSVISRWMIYELPLRLGYITSRWMTSNTPTQTETNKISWCIISMGEQYNTQLILAAYSDTCYWDDDIWFDKSRHNVIAILLTEPLPDRRHVCQPHAEYGYIGSIE